MALAAATYIVTHRHEFDAKARGEETWKNDVSGL